MGEECYATFTVSPATKARLPNNHGAAQLLLVDQRIKEDHPMRNRTTKTGSLISEAINKGDADIEAGAARTMDGIIERFRSDDLDLISWKDITQKYQLCIAKPSLLRRISRWLRR